jgi:CRISPR/Cas system-associated exonuclease Cas4 (RecB family)
MAPPLKRTLSPSQVNEYLDCPFRWYCSSVLRLPEPVTDSLAVGQAMHQTAAALLARKRGGQPVTPDVVGEICAQACDDQLSLIETTAPRDEEEASELAADRAAGEDQVRTLTDLWWQAAAPSIAPAQIELATTGHIAGVEVHAIIDCVDESGTVIDLKTAAKRPNGISAPHRLQVITYAMLHAPADESHTARLDYLTKTKTPAYVQLKTGLQEPDYRYAEAIYPMVAAAMDDGLYLPNRGSNLCSRRYCAHWEACEAEFGGQVKA